jgi:hypothetical protein
LAPSGFLAPSSSQLSSLRADKVSEVAFRASVSGGKKSVPGGEEALTHDYVRV